jgi:hypothetical protein
MSREKAACESRFLVLMKGKALVLDRDAEAEDLELNEKGRAKVRVGGMRSGARPDAASSVVRAAWRRSDLPTCIQPADLRP